MLTSAQIKDYALNELGVDKIGIANIERFQDAPDFSDPKNIMPRCKSVIVFLLRVPRGCYRGIEEGTHWPSYTVFGYTGIARQLIQKGYYLSKFIEKSGYEAAIVTSATTVPERGPRGNAIPGKARREVSVHHRIAAYHAGLGEIGFSKVFLTEEFGPRQRIGIVLTELPLEPDPIPEPHLCDRCGACVRSCPGAMSRTETVKTVIGGREMEWAQIETGRCKQAHFGFDRKTSPFFVKRFPGVYMPMDKQQNTWLQAHDFGHALFAEEPTLNALNKHEFYLAVCGARGCQRACMKHLEMRGKLKENFEKKVFAPMKYWELPEEPEPTKYHGFAYAPGEPMPDEVGYFGAGSWY